MAVTEDDTEGMDKHRGKSERTRLSIRMSYALRHSPDRLGLTMAPDGTVRVSDLAVALGTDVDAVIDIVATDAKGRYVLTGEVGPEQRIHAAQGHTIDVDVPLVALNAADIAGMSFYHGTKTAFLDSILDQGLLPRSRQFVHLSTDVDTSTDVANRRDGASAVLVVDAAAMLTDGFTLYRASNGVILTRTVPSRYLSVLN